MVEECAAFPNGSNDDQVDSAIMAWARFRQGNFIALDSDEKDEEHPESAALEYY
jgi:hypothetical protein